MPITKSHLESCFAFVGVYDNFFKTVSQKKKKKKIKCLRLGTNDEFCIAWRCICHP